MESYNTKTCIQNEQTLTIQYTSHTQNTTKTTTKISNQIL